MFHSEVILLITYDEVVDGVGDTIKAPTNRPVFAEVKSIRQTEFYQAAATGLKPEIMFEIHPSDYKDEKQVAYLDKEYRVIRTYLKNPDLLEIICEGVVNDG